VIEEGKEKKECRMNYSSVSTRQYSHGILATAWTHYHITGILEKLWKSKSVIIKTNTYLCWRQVYLDVVCMWSMGLLQEMVL